MVYLCRKLAFEAIKSLEQPEPFPTMLFKLMGFRLSRADPAAKKTKTNDHRYHRNAEMSSELGTIVPEPRP
jgi:hypothetical protein